MTSTIGKIDNLPPKPHFSILLIEFETFFGANSNPISLEMVFHKANREGNRLEKSQEIKAENSRLKKQLHNLSSLHAKIKHKRQVKDAIHKEIMNHEKKMKSLKVDHDEEVKANLALVEENKQQHLDAINEQVEHYLKLKNEYYETRKKLSIKEKDLCNTLRTLRDINRKSANDEVFFYRNQLSALRAKANSFRRKYLKEHLDFVKDCIEKRKKENRSKRSIMAKDEDTHDADVISLVAYLRKDIRQLENIVDMLHGSIKNVLFDLNLEEEKDVDILSIDPSEGCSRSFDGENLIQERS